MRYILITLFMVVSACGGGGGSGNQTPPNNQSPSTPVVQDEDSQGFWRGTSSNGRPVDGIILDDGSYYVLYYTDSKRDFISGIVHGKSSSMSGDAFSSISATDYFIEEGVIYTGLSVTGTLKEKSTFSGSIKYSANETVNFTSAYVDAYEITPSLDQLAGSFAGNVAFAFGIEGAVLSIGPDGSLTGIGQSGCSLTGNVSTNTSGNIFDLDVTFGGYPCASANNTFQGIVYYEHDTGVAIGVVSNSSNTDGFLFAGTKQ